MKPFFQPSMKSVLAAAVLLFFLLPAFHAPAQTAPKSPIGPISPRAAAYDSFKTIRTRNIFDPDRKPNAPAKASRPTGPGAIPEYVALTGVLLKSEVNAVNKVNPVPAAPKALAFFSGSRPEYNKVLSVGAQIAGATITRIHPAAIEVQREGKTIKVGIGQTVPFDDSAPVAAPIPAVSTPSATSSSQAAPSSSPSGGSREEIMRRMMERRQSELK